MTEAFDEANRILYELRRDGLLRIPLSEFEYNPWLIAAKQQAENLARATVGWWEGPMSRR